MTAGHKHREVRVRSGGLIERFLTAPIYATFDKERVERSRVTYRVEKAPWPARVDSGHMAQEDWYVTSLLGILHGFTGLTLRTPGE